MIFCDKILYNFTVPHTKHSSMQELTWWSFNIHDSQFTGLGFQPAGICSKWHEMTNSAWYIAQIPNMVAKLFKKKHGSLPSPVKKKKRENHAIHLPNDYWILFFKNLRNIKCQNKEHGILAFLSGFCTLSGLWLFFLCLIFQFEFYVGNWWLLSLCLWYICLIFVCKTATYFPWLDIQLGCYTVAECKRD